MPSTHGIKIIEVGATAAMLQASWPAPQDGHRNLVMTMAMDLSAKLGKELAYPVNLDELGEPED